MNLPQPQPSGLKPGSVSFTQLLSVIEDKTKMTYLALLDGKPIAQADVSDWDKAGGWINWVFVTGEWQRHGVGRALLQYIMQQAVEAGKEGLGLSVKFENEPAMQLYRSLGFRPLYSYDETFCAMGVQLNICK